MITKDMTVGEIVNTYPKAKRNINVIWDGMLRMPVSNYGIFTTSMHSSRIRVRKSFRKVK